MKRALLFLGCYFVYFLSFAQEDIRTKGTNKNADKKNDSATPQSKPTNPNSLLTEITGKVVDEATNEPLIGVYIKVEGKIAGTITGNDGTFRFSVDLSQPINLVFSYVGYASITLPVSKGANTNISIKMKEESIMAKEVVISASRVSETILESPITVEKIDLLTIKELPATSVYDAVATMKGADQMGTSMLFKVINTRGFNSTTNTRFVQRVDNMDTQAPGLNFSMGAVTGGSDLDIANVELIPGAASALYGPNAFNGILNVTTKDPFKYPGVSASIRGGANHLDGKDAPVSPYYDAAIRFAKVINNRLGFKFNLSMVKANDWHSTDYQDVANYSGVDVNTPGPQNPGYDGLNIYGDEVSIVVDSLTLAGFGIAGVPLKKTRIGRNGFREQDLVDYNTYNFKADFSLHYRINEKIEISGLSRYSNGTTVYQSQNRYSIKDFNFTQHKIELNGDNFFLRAYGSFENAGKSYDSRFAAINVNRMAKSDANWFNQYFVAYSGKFVNDPMLSQIYSIIRPNGPAIKPLDHDAARAFANANNEDIYRGLVQLFGGDPNHPSALPFKGRAAYQAGTPEFEQALDKVTSIANFGNGARFLDKSSLYHVEGQYNFKNEVKFMDLLAGGNYRAYIMNSQGTIFSDTNGVLKNYEFGVYVQASKRLLKNHLKLIGSIRTDKNTNFQWQYSPRIAAIVSLGKNNNHNFRVSAQTGFRMPTLQAQYINLFVSVYQYIGALRPSDEAHGIIGNCYTSNSVSEYDEAVKNGVANPEKYLHRALIENIRPEKVQTFECGYKTLLFNKLYVDLNYYFNQYHDFLGSFGLWGPKKDSTGQFYQLTPGLMANPNRDNYLIRYQRFINTPTKVTAHGFSIGTMYAFSPKFSLTANYNFNEQFLTEDILKDDIINGFNTPKHKTNVGFAGRNLAKNFGFAINYRWNDTYEFFDGFGRGMVPAYNVVDAQVSYRVPKINTNFRIGGTNILNNRHTEAYGSPTIGAMVYFQIIYDQLF
ncbi:MAG: TonB-dependent receptor [Bacteroidia bacterium]|nr:TonB-dependent receptor [Bacteroidia bacterium]